MEENQPLPHLSRRAAIKPPLPLEATPIRSKRSHLTESSTSQTYGSFELPKTPISVSTVTQVTPIITSIFVTKVESPQLLEDTRSEPSEIVTQVV